MDKEAREKIAVALYLFCGGQPEDALSKSQDYLIRASRIICIMKELGYRKLPEGEPPLVEGHWVDEARVFNKGAEAQRDADIKFYTEGK